MITDFRNEPLILPDHVRAALQFDVEQAAATAPSPEDVMEQTQRADRLAEALRRLPKRR